MNASQTTHKKGKFAGGPNLYCFLLNDNKSMWMARLFCRIYQIIINLVSSFWNAVFDINKRCCLWLYLWVLQHICYCGRMSDLQFLGFLKIDGAWVLIAPFSFLIWICINDLTALIYMHLERVYASSFLCLTYWNA